MYALVEILGKQYKIEQGSLLKIDHLPQEKGSRVEFPGVLMVSDGEKVRIGSPYLKGVIVEAVVQDHGRDRKITIGKFKKKKRYRRTIGYRGQYSLIKIEAIKGLR
jgi:large subunit ribosomal protein L21